ncbi:MAG: glucokinase, partial [Campylobacterota bacterium]|nr:glucokinase [Campylobacterota bacterium]
MILAGDIGGTKTNLALYKIENETLTIEAQQQFASRDFSSLVEVIIAFEAQTSMPKIDAACFGIAGPVIEGRCRTTNLPW